MPPQKNSTTSKKTRCIHKEKVTTIKKLANGGKFAIAHKKNAHIHTKRARWKTSHYKL
jgi:hypothetical protein